MVTIGLKGFVGRCYGASGMFTFLMGIFWPLTHHDRLGQLALRTDGVERPAEQPTSRRERQLVQVRRGSSPERPGDERAPPFEGLLGKVCGFESR